MRLVRGLLAWAWGAALDVLWLLALLGIGYAALAVLAGPGQQPWAAEALRAVDGWVGSLRHALAGR